ncbi:MAG: enoyl-CoA hydratase/isomerase family protein [Desulfatibacillum sp.]|nr:enoyl-CoA hydratase/isomerase family protein [Desulfatibacillum sp.]
MSDSVLYEKRESTGILTINKPKANQLSAEVFEGMSMTLDLAAQDKDLRALIITGSGDRIFCAGADLSGGFGNLSPIDFLKRAQDIFNKIEAFPRPVIAAMIGHAFGGGLELAMACHMRFLKKGARIGLTETNLGIMPGYGGTLRLPRLVGRAKAIEMMLLGQQIKADEALELGLVNRVCEDGTVMDQALEMAATLATRPPLALSAILRVLSMRESISPELALQLERQELVKLFESKDCMEGMTAFAMKTQPVFKGE